MEPRLTFHGAARAVTGSCFRPETGGGRILFDCGLIQLLSHAPTVDPGSILRPVLDEAFELTRAGARLDWHNDVSRLFLDIDDALADAADERARDALIRRLRRALDDGRDRPPHP